MDIMKIPPPRNQKVTADMLLEKIIEMTNKQVSRKVAAGIGVDTLWLVLGMKPGETLLLVMDLIAQGKVELQVPKTASKNISGMSRVILTAEGNNITEKTVTTSGANERATVGRALRGIEMNDNGANQ